MITCIYLTPLSFSMFQSIIVCVHVGCVSLSKLKKLFPGGNLFKRNLGKIPKCSVHSNENMCEEYDRDNKSWNWRTVAPISGTYSLWEVMIVIMWKVLFCTTCNVVTMGVAVIFCWTSLFNFIGGKYMYNIKSLLF